jgi:hypothetical protein
MAFERSTATPEYPVSWVDGAHARHLGRARFDGTNLVLDGAAPGNPRRTIHIPRRAIHGVNLHRWAPAPAVAVTLPDGDIVIEVVFGGWGAAHQLAHAIAGIAQATSDERDGIPDPTGRLTAPCPALQVRAGAGESIQAS